MKHPAATRSDHERFCRTEGWHEVRTDRGKTGTHHVTYELTLGDGRILRTRISHPPDRSTYGRRLFAHILRDQLQVTAPEFWACVRDGTPPRRGERRREGHGIPAEIVFQLVVRWHVPEDAVAKMTRQQAVDRLHSLWSQEDLPMDGDRFARYVNRVRRDPGRARAGR